MIKTDRRSSAYRAMLSGYGRREDFRPILIVSGPDDAIWLAAMLQVSLKAIKNGASAVMSNELKSSVIFYGKQKRCRQRRPVEEEPGVRVPWLFYGDTSFLSVR